MNEWTIALFAFWFAPALIALWRGCGLIAFGLALLCCAPAPLLPPLWLAGLIVGCVWPRARHGDRGAVL